MAVASGNAAARSPAPPASALAAPDSALRVTRTLHAATGGLGKTVVFPIFLLLSKGGKAFFSQVFKPTERDLHSGPHSSTVRCNWIIYDK